MINIIRHGPEIVATKICLYFKILGRSCQKLLHSIAGGDMGLVS